MVTTIYVPENKMAVWEALEKIARREYQDMSPLIMKAVEEYVKKHADGNSLYTMEKWVDNSDFKATPAFDETNEKWDTYLKNCNRKELAHVEGKSIYLRKLSHQLWLEKRE